MKKKNEIVLKKNNDILVTVEPPDENMDLGRQINYFQEIVKQSASIGCTAAVINGVLLVKAQQSHPNSFEEWLEANTAVSRSTSYNYMAAAKKTLGTGIVDELAMHGTLEIAEKVQQAMVKLQLESKPLTELYCDVGIVKRTASRMGGKREGAGRKRKDDLAAEAERQAAELGAEAVKKLAGDIYNVAVIQGGLGNCADTVLAEVVSTLKAIVREGEEIIKSRKANAK